MTSAALLAGAEPFAADGGPVGVLVSHGFTGSPQSMRFLAEQYAEGGLTVRLPRLHGHGTTPEEMAASSAERWIRDLETAFEELRARCEKVFVTGLSMGGTLTLYIAGAYAGQVAGIIPINAAVTLNSPDLAGLAFHPAAPPAVPGVGSDIKQPGITELAYPVVPVPAIRQLYALMAVTRELLPRITCPALLLTSREDHVVPPMNGPLILEELGSTDKRLLWLEQSYHVATLDNDKELIASETLAFIRAHS
jgi:carboxylesterase